jgi:predicted nucleic acid-binding protein
MLSRVTGSKTGFARPGGDKSVLTLDTSALYAIVREDDEHHYNMLRARDEDPGPYFVPAGILAETAYMVEANLPLQGLIDLLGDLATGAYTVDCGDGDFPRISDLVQRYADLRLGFSDAAVIACAERHRGRVLSSDRRDFNVVAREGTITVVP